MLLGSVTQDSLNFDATFEFLGQITVRMTFHKDVDNFLGKAQNMLFW